MRARIAGAWTLGSLSLRPKDLLGPVTRVKKEKSLHPWASSSGYGMCEAHITHADLIFGRSLPSVAVRLVHRSLPPSRVAHDGRFWRGPLGSWAKSAVEGGTLPVFLAVRYDRRLL